MNEVIILQFSHNVSICNHHLVVYIQSFVTNAIIIYIDKCLANSKRLPNQSTATVGKLKRFRVKYTCILYKKCNRYRET